MLAVVGSAWSNPTPDAAPATHMGLTAQQWQKRLVAERHRLNAQLKRTASEVKRLRRAVKNRIAVVGSHPLERAFLCIHSFEGSWTDPNAPYWGGMQMDRGFMTTYGREFYNAWGTADNWPISVQLAVAMKAYLSGRGFYPWPNTRLYCHLPGFLGG